MNRRLTLTERSALHQRLLAGQITRDAFKAMTLDAADRAVAEMFLPKARATAGVPAHRADELEKIAEGIKHRLRGSALQEPVNFLLHAEPERLRPLLDPADFTQVMEVRRRRTSTE